MLAAELTKSSKSFDAQHPTIDSLRFVRRRMQFEVKVLRSRTEDHGSKGSPPAKEKSILF